MSSDGSPRRVFPFALTAAFGAVVVGAAVTSAADPPPINGPVSASSFAVRGEQMMTQPLPQPSTSTYRVTLVIEWSGSSHPATLPPNSHISPPVVATHSEAGDMFRFGTLASDGIESMAEIGATTTLVSELVNDGTVDDVEVGSRIDGPGNQSFEVELTQSNDLISLVTMLAPSPDWFVGFADVELFANGEWKQEVSFDLTPYDAGTDSGATFTSGNANTSPAELISGPRDANFVQAAGENRFGFVTIKRLGD